MRKRLTYSFPARVERHRLLEVDHVLDVLSHRDRCDTDVLILLERQFGSRPSQVGDAIAERCAAKDRPARDFAQPLLLHEIERTLENGETESDAFGELGAGELSAEIQQLQ